MGASQFGVKLQVGGVHLAQKFDGKTVGGIAHDAAAHLAQVHIGADGGQYLALDGSAGHGNVDDLTGILATVGKTDVRCGLFRRKAIMAALLGV